MRERAIRRLLFRLSRTCGLMLILLVSLGSCSRSPSIDEADAISFESLPSSVVTTQQVVGLDAPLRIETGVDREKVTVGEPFVSLVRVMPPAGVAVAFDELVDGDSLQSIAPVKATDAMNSGVRDGSYTLVAWTAGALPEALVSVRLTDPEGRMLTAPVRLELPLVESVLPDSDRSIQPRPAKGVVVPPLLGKKSWLWILWLSGALAAGVLGYWILDRRRDLEEVASIDPCEWANNQLTTIGSGDLTVPEVRIEIHNRVSHVLRTYLSLVTRGWGLELTTTELLAVVADVVEEELRHDLERLLESTDMVKFAGRVPTVDETAALVTRARVWISRYPQVEEPASSRAA